MACTFNGPAKTITVDTGATDISVKGDIYSEWKEWLLVGTNISYLPAMRSIGGDPIGGGKYAGDMYFLMNGWTVVIDHEVSVDGILFRDDSGTPIFTLASGGAVRSTVSNLAQSISATGFSQSDLELELLPLMTEIQKTLKKVEEAQAFILSA